MGLKRFSHWLIAWLSISLSPLAGGHGYPLGDLKIVHPWAMPAAASTHGGASGIGFVVLRNAGRQADRLRSVSTAIAAKVELHHYSKGAGPVMRQTGSLDIPAGAEVRLEPGGSHLMLVGLKKPLAEGDHFPVTLQFERAGEITVEMVVQLKAKEAVY